MQICRLGMITAHLLSSQELKDEDSERPIVTWHVMTFVEDDFRRHILWRAAEGPGLPSKPDLLGETKVHLNGVKNKSIYVLWKLWKSSLRIFDAFEIAWNNMKSFELWDIHSNWKGICSWNLRNQQKLVTAHFCRRCIPNGNTNSTGLWIYVTVFSGGFRGGGHSRPVPPLLKQFSINAPLFVHVPPPLLKPKKKKKKKKKKVSDSAWLYPGCYFPPPPDVDGAPKKKVLESPPPPRLSAFLGLARVSRLAAVRKKQYVMPPLSQIPGSAGDCVAFISIAWLLYDNNFVELGQGALQSYPRGYIMWINILPQSPSVWTGIWIRDLLY